MLSPEVYLVTARIMALAVALGFGIAATLLLFGEEKPRVVSGAISIISAVLAIFIASELPLATTERGFTTLQAIGTVLLVVALGLRYYYWFTVGTKTRAGQIMYRGFLTLLVATLAMFIGIMATHTQWEIRWQAFVFFCAVVGTVVGLIFLVTAVRKPKSEEQ